MIGYCFRTSATASRPSSTSCSGVNLFLGGVILVCAEGKSSSSITTATVITQRGNLARIVSQTGNRRRRRFALGFRGRPPDHPREAEQREAECAARHHVAAALGGRVEKLPVRVYLLAPIELLAPIDGIG